MALIEGRGGTVAALGVIEILAWGSTFYLPAILAAPLAADTGWPPGAITGGLSAGLLVSGLAARRVGRTIQEFGGRNVLSAGVALIALGLVTMGLAPALPVYFAAWVILGFGMAASLYEAAFSTLGRLYGHDARRAITVLTLWAGFASTICWPLSAFLVETFGWRATCFAYAALHLALTLPLCRALPSAPPVPASPVQAPRTGGPLDLRFWCIAVAGAALTALFSVMSVHLVPILTTTGLTLAAAVALGALIGPAQVGARMLELMGGGRHHPVWTMVAASALVATGLVGLRLGLPAAAALVAYGAGTGLWSIARGTLPLAVFGPDDYAPMMGRIALPVLAVSAAAPLAGTALIAWLGPQGTLAALALLAIVPCTASLALAARLARDR